MDFVIDNVKNSPKNILDMVEKKKQIFFLKRQKYCNVLIKTCIFIFQHLNLIFSMVCNGKTKKGVKCTRSKDSKHARLLNAKKKIEKSAKANAQIFFFASLEEKLVQERLKYEKSNELTKEIKNCSFV